MSFLLPSLGFVLLCVAIVLLVTGAVLKQKVYMKLFYANILNVIVGFAMMIYVRITDNPSTIDIVFIYLLISFIFTLAFLHRVLANEV